MFPVTAIEFYSGIGGLHRALSRSNVDAQVIRAFDWDQTSCRVYEANHGKGIVEKADISKLEAAKLAELNADLWLLSPACQPYTVLNPNAQGALDPRAKSFLHLIQDVLPELVTQKAAPRRLLVENVAGFEASSTRELLIDTLKTCGYSIAEFLLTPLQFGIPNSRLRYYLLAKHRPLSFANQQATSTGILRYIPGHGESWIDDLGGKTVASTSTIDRYLDEGLDESSMESLRIPDRVLEKWGKLFDIVKPSSRRTCCFTRGYTQMVERTGSIIQMNEALDTTAIFDQFLEAQIHFTGLESDPLAHTQPPIDILKPLQLRYFSPNELLRIFHFTPPHPLPKPISRPSLNSDDPICSNSQENFDILSSGDDFVWPTDVSQKSKYRLIGNSVNVDVVRRLIDCLFEGDVG